MSDLFRFVSLRPAQLLSEENRDTIGLRLFGDGETSSRMMALIPLFELNDHTEIYNALVTFLRSPDSITTENDLSDPIRAFVSIMRRRGKRLSVVDVKNGFDIAVLANYFEPVTGATVSEYVIEKQRIEDTIMALAFIGKLGNRKNADLQRMYRATQIAKAVQDHEGEEIPPGLLRELLTKPIVVPPYRYNPCAIRYEEVRPYQHLDLEPIEAPTTPGGATELKTDGKLEGEEPTDCNCNCDCDDACCQDPSTCCAELRPFVADLMIVREELKCYEAHHLAYIETLMAGETRSREHRTLDRVETYTESETETTKLIERDHQVEDRFSLKSEIDRTISLDTELEAGVSITSEFGKTNKIVADFGFSLNSSREESYKLARDYSRDVTTRALTRVEEKVRTLNTTRRLSEVEETNTHGFVNDGNKHINGQYHFVNMINKAQVMNYGKRLMFEFVLPEPMELYKKLLEKNVKPFGMEKPEKPKVRIDQIQQGPRRDDNVTPTDSYTHPDGTISWNDTGVYNYQDLMLYYNLSDVEGMKDPDIRLDFSFENSTKVQGHNDILTFKEQIGMVPTGYNARMLTVDIKGYDTEGNLITAPDDGSVVIELQWFANGVSGGVVPSSGFVAAQTVTMNIDATQDTQLSLVVMAKSTAGVAGSGTVTCLLSDQAKTEWRTMVWGKIMAKYEEDLQAYETALARYEQDKNARLPFGNNPFINREIEATELKRLAISYISCQFYEQFDAMRRNVKPCGYPEMNIPEAQSEGSFIRFFEQLFQWNLMTYLFYPYFWGQKCSWPEKVQTSSGDPLFDKALMAGAARVQIPVRPGMEPLAMHWVNYREIWEGESEPPIAGDDYYLSMAQEIKEQKNCFYRDREGELLVTVGSDTVLLSGTDYYWDNVNNVLNTANIEADINREIILNTCEVYRIVSIADAGESDHSTWTIGLERAYEGTGCCGCDEAVPGTDHVPFQTGAVFVGAPFEVVVPTNLVYLRNRKDPVTNEYLTAECLPCYPLENKCD